MHLKTLHSISKQGTTKITKYLIIIIYGLTELFLLRFPTTFQISTLASPEQLRQVLLSLLLLHYNYVVVTILFLLANIKCNEAHSADSGFKADILQGQNLQPYIHSRLLCLSMYVCWISLLSYFLPTASQVFVCGFCFCNSILI